MILPVATLPSTKPWGMALGARMEYLKFASLPCCEESSTILKFIYEPCRNHCLCSTRPLYIRFFILKYYVKLLPLFEFRVDHPTGEALATDTDSLQYTVTL